MPAHTTIINSLDKKTSVMEANSTVQNLYTVVKVPVSKPLESPTYVDCREWGKRGLMILLVSVGYCSRVG